MGKLNKYPVSREVCEGCSSCILVTETITGYHIDEDNQYYQCISDMESECSSICEMDMSTDLEVNPAWTEEDQAEFDRLYPLGADEWVGF